MAMPHTFRNALNGFNKDDVVRYLEYINTKHANQVQQLTAEIEELRAEQKPSPSVDQQAIIDALQKENDSLSARLLESEKARTALLEELTQLRRVSAPAPVQEMSSVVSDELEAYRRAERTEREARKRAELVYYQANSILSETTTKVDSVSEEITTMADKMMTQLTQMQLLVSGSKQELQNAAALLGSIRPNP